VHSTVSIDELNRLFIIVQDIAFLGHSAQGGGEFGLTLKHRDGQETHVKLILGKPGKVEVQN
jgi:hypothetical protein